MEEKEEKVKAAFEESRYLCIGLDRLIINDEEYCTLGKRRSELFFFHVVKRFRLCGLGFYTPYIYFFFVFSQ